MMKISDPIMFGHAVTVFYKDVFDKHGATLKELGVNPNLGLGELYKKIQSLPEAKRAEIEADIKAVYAKQPGPGHGRFRQGDHQPAHPQRHHRRRLHAGRGSRSRQDVEHRGETAGHQGDDPRPLLCHHVQGDHRGLPEKRRFRSGHHGLGPQRRPDGPESRRVRLPPHDLRDPGRRHHARRDGRRQGTDGACCRGRRHLAPVAGQGHSDSGLGQAGCEPRPRHRRTGSLLARQEPGPRHQRHCQSRKISEGP